MKGKPEYAKKACKTLTWVGATQAEIDSFSADIVRSAVRGADGVETNDKPSLSKLLATAHVRFAGLPADV